MRRGSLDSAKGGGSFAGPRTVAALDAAFVKEAALAAGFHKAGIARACPLDPGPLDRMLSCGAEADMVWLRTQRDERLDPSRLLPGAKSVLALALSYLEADGAPEPAEGRVARYARRRRRTVGGGRRARRPGGLARRLDRGRGGAPGRAARAAPDRRREGQGRERGLKVRACEEYPDRARRAKR